MVHRMITPAPTPPLTAANLNDFDSERERLHRQMLSSVSHDLKTPLASIIGALEVFERMKDKLPDDKKLALVNVALQESYRLDMAKLDNDMVKVNEEGAEVNALVRNCLIRLNNRLHGSTVHFTPGAPLDVMTDPVLLSRAVCLVLDNAVKYGGTPSVIDISCYIDDESKSGIIEIHDNGSGIPETQTEVIFSKYTRSVKQDQQNAGTGLGLAICRAIMDLLGGTISAGNHPEGGALLTLRFPTQ